MSGAEHFVAEYAFVATWGNVTFLGISEHDLRNRPVSLILISACFRTFLVLRVDITSLQRNSFQAVIVTDVAANLTFAIFNYEKIEWAASTEFGGNSLTGLSTTNGAKVPQLAS